MFFGLRSKGLMFLWLFFIAATISVEVAEANPEKYYQEKWCKERSGKTEVVLSNKTRVDCLTDEYAIEFDFAKKWAEAIGQSLGYALETGRQPGIVLILTNKNDYKYWIRLNTIIDFYKLNIKTWLLSAY